MVSYGMSVESEEPEYDVVIDVLQKHHDKLWDITKRNMNSEFLGMGIMDDIRLSQMNELKEAMKLWRANKNE
jgi:hypothetical protein